MGADSQGVVLALAALKSNIVNKAFKVNNCNVSVRNRSFHGHHSGIVLPLLVQIRIHLFIGYCDVDLLHFHTLIFSKGYFRLQGYFRCENKRLSSFDLRYIYLGGRNYCIFALFHSLFVCFGNQGIGSIFIEEFLTVQLLDHLAWHFTLTESGNLNFSLIFLVSLFNSSFQLFCRNFNCKLCHVFFQFFHL